MVLSLGSAVDYKSFDRNIIGSRMSKKDKETETFDTDSSELNETLMDEFSESLERTINEVADQHPDVDPRLELLVTLGLFCSQVAIETGYTKREFLQLVGDLYDDFDGEIVSTEVDPQNLN